MNSQDTPNILMCAKDTLKLSYGMWLMFRLFIMPLVMSHIINQGAYGEFLAWQGITLIPAFLFGWRIWRANSPYGLIVASFVVMVYLGVSSSHLLIAWYEQKGMLLIGTYALESVMLLVVLGGLFMVLKKLPPMHKNH